MCVGRGAACLRFAIATHWVRWCAFQAFGILNVSQGMLPSGAPSARHKQSLQVLFYKCLHLCQTSAWHGADVQFFSARLISTLGGNICVWSDLVQSINNFSCKIKHVFIVFCCVQLFLWLFYCCFVVVIVFIIFVVFAIVCLFCVLLFLLCVFFIVFVIVVLLFFIFKYYLFF